MLLAAAFVAVSVSDFVMDDDTAIAVTFGADVAVDAAAVSFKTW